MTHFGPTTMKALEFQWVHGKNKRKTGFDYGNPKTRRVEDFTVTLPD